MLSVEKNSQDTDLLLQTAVQVSVNTTDINTCDFGRNYQEIIAKYVTIYNPNQT